MITKTTYRTGTMVFYTITVRFFSFSFNNPNEVGVPIEEKSQLQYKRIKRALVMSKNKKYVV